MRRQSVEQRVLAGRAVEEELTHSERAVLEPTAAGDERERPGTAAQTRGLDVEDDHVRRPVGDRAQRRVKQRNRRGRIDRVGLHAPAPMPLLRLPDAIDDDAGARPDVMPGAPKSRGRSIQIESRRHQIGNVRELAKGGAAIRPGKVAGRRSPSDRLPDDRAVDVRSRMTSGTSPPTPVAVASGAPMAARRSGGHSLSLVRALHRSCLTGLWQVLALDHARRGQHGEQPGGDGLGGGPVPPSGPTQDGHPDSQGQPSMSWRVRASRAPCMANNGSLKPMPPG